jgi:hypothetical protein
MENKIKELEIKLEKLKKLWMYPEKVAEVLRELDLYYKLYKNVWDNKWCKVSPTLGVW